MRTLKKALCLVLVLAMALSLAVPGFAAVTDSKDYTDYSTIKNTEAVAVLTKVGVLHGNDDNSFGPEGSFTRAQAATMIAHMILGENATALLGSATGFNDVPATHWASGYIQFAVSQGIINGYGDGRFGPDDTLTATQWALMLLGALGYKATNEGIGGAGWAIATTKLAILAGVANAEDLTGTFNRDVAAKMALNTLTADMVRYSDSLSINQDGEISNNFGKTANKITNNSADDYRTVSGERDSYAQFCEVYIPSLSMTSVINTAGQPSKQWNYKNVKFGTYAKTPAFTFTASASGSTDSAVASNLGLKGYTFAEHTVSKATKAEVIPMINGVTGTPIDCISNLVSGKQQSGALAELMGNGTIVEVYVSDTTAQEITDIVVTQPQLMQISAKNSTAKTVSLKQVASMGQASINKVDEDNTYYTELSNMNVDDYVMIYPLKNDNGGYDVNGIFVPQTATGRLSKVSVKSGYNYAVTVGTTNYNVAKVSDSEIQKLTSASTKNPHDCTVYTDAYDYAVYMKDVEVATNYILVTSTYETMGDRAIVKCVEGVDMKGEVINLNLGANPKVEGAMGKVFSYTTYNESDAAQASREAEYELKDQLATVSLTSDLKTSSIEIPGSVTLGKDQLNRFSSDVNFLFIVRNTKGDITNVLSKTGRQNVKSGETVVPVFNTKGYISTVVVDAEPEDLTGVDVLFLDAKLWNNSSVGTKDAREYTVYENGEKWEDRILSTNLDLEGKFVTYAKGDNDVYTLKEYTAFDKATSVVAATLAVGNMDKANLSATFTGVTQMDGKTAISNVNLIDASSELKVYLTDAKVLDLRSNSTIGSAAELAAVVNADDATDLLVYVVFNNAGDNNSKNGTVNCVYIVGEAATAPVDAANPTVSKKADVTTAGINESKDYEVEATVSDGGVLSYAWKIQKDSDPAENDATTAAKLAKSFAEAGTYTITCTVTNTLASATGNKTATAEVTWTVAVS